MQQSLLSRKEKKYWRHVSKQRHAGSVSSTVLCGLPVTSLPHFTSFHLPLLRSGTWGPGNLYHLCYSRNSPFLRQALLPPGGLWDPSTMLGYLPEKPGLEAKGSQVEGREKVHTTKLWFVCDNFFFSNNVVKHWNADTDHYCVLRLCFRFSVCLFCGSFFS